MTFAYKLSNKIDENPKIKKIFNDLFDANLTEVELIRKSGEINQIWKTQYKGEELPHQKKTIKLPRGFSLTIIIYDDDSVFVIANMGVDFKYDMLLKDVIKETQIDEEPRMAEEISQSDEKSSDFSLIERIKDILGIR